MVNRHFSWSAHSRLAGLPDEILVCPDGQGRAREVGLPRHEHVFDAAGAAAALVRGHAGPGDVRGAGRLLAAADREDLGVARGSRGVEELRRVALDDTSPVGGQVELVDHEPGLLAGVVAAVPMIPHVDRRQVSHDKDPVPVEVGAAVKPLGVGLLLGRNVGEAVPDPRHWAADRAHRPQAGQRLRWQRFDIQCTPGGVFIDGGDDVADWRRIECDHGDYSSSQSRISFHHVLVCSLAATPSGSLVLRLRCLRCSWSGCLKHQI